MTETQLELNDKNVDEHSETKGLSLGSIVLIIGVVALVAVVGLQLARQNTPYLESGNRAPDFVVTTYDGDEIKLSDLRGKVVVVNFWASWCGPCEDEAPVLQETWEKYASEDFIMIGIAHSDVERNARAFMEEYAITYPNAPDPGGRLYDAYNLRGVPETFVIAPDGELSYVLPGPLGNFTTPEFIETIDALLAGVS